VKAKLLFESLIHLVSGNVSFWCAWGVVALKLEFVHVSSFYGETMIDIDKTYMKR
jgi:hypothetical protein